MGKQGISQEVEIARVKRESQLQSQENLAKLPQKLGVSLDSQGTLIFPPEIKNRLESLAPEERRHVQQLLERILFEQEESKKPKSIGERFLGRVENSAKGLSHTLEATARITLGNIYQLFATVLGLCRLENPLEVWIKAGEQYKTGSKYVFDNFSFGSVYPGEKKLAQMGKLEQIMLSNPLAHLSKAIFDPLYDGIDYLKNESRRKLMNYCGANLSEQQFLELAKNDPVLRVSNFLLSFAQSCLMVASMLCGNPLGLLRLSKVLGSTGLFGAVSTLGNELLHQEEISLIRLAEGTVDQMSKSLLFSGVLRSLGPKYAGLGHKIDFVDAQGDLSASAVQLSNEVEKLESWSELKNNKVQRKLVGASILVGTSAYDAVDTKATGVLKNEIASLENVIGDFSDIETADQLVLDLNLKRGNTTGNLSRVEKYLGGPGQKTQGVSFVIGFEELKLVGVGEETDSGKVEIGFDRQLRIPRPVDPYGKTDFEPENSSKSAGDNKGNGSERTTDATVRPAERGTIKLSPEAKVARIINEIISRVNNDKLTGELRQKFDELSKKGVRFNDLLNFAKDNEDFDGESFIKTFTTALLYNSTYISFDLAIKRNGGYLFENERGKVSREKKVVTKKPVANSLESRTHAQEALLEFYRMFEGEDFYKLLGYKLNHQVFGALRTLTEKRLLAKSIRKLLSTNFSTQDEVATRVVQIVNSINGPKCEEIIEDLPKVLERLKKPLYRRSIKPLRIMTPVTILAKQDLGADILQIANLAKLFPPAVEVLIHDLENENVKVYKTWSFETIKMSTKEIICLPDDEFRRFVARIVRQDRGSELCQELSFEYISCIDQMPRIEEILAEQEIRITFNHQDFIDSVLEAYSCYYTGSKSGSGQFNFSRFLADVAQARKKYEFKAAKELTLRPQDQKKLVYLFTNLWIDCSKKGIPPLEIAACINKLSRILGFKNEEIILKMLASVLKEEYKKNFNQAVFIKTWLKSYQAIFKYFGIKPKRIIGINQAFDWIASFAETFPQTKIAVQVSAKELLRFLSDFEIEDSISGNELRGPYLETVERAKLDLLTALSNPDSDKSYERRIAPLREANPELVKDPLVHQAALQYFKRRFEAIRKMIGNITYGFLAKYNIAVLKPLTLLHFVDEFIRLFSLSEQEIVADENFKPVVKKLVFKSLNIKLTEEDIEFLLKMKTLCKTTDREFFEYTMRLYSEYYAWYPNKTLDLVEQNIERLAKKEPKLLLSKKEKLELKLGAIKQAQIQLQQRILILERRLKRDEVFSAHIENYLLIRLNDISILRERIKQLEQMEKELSAILGV